MISAEQKQIIEQTKDEFEGLYGPKSKMGPIASLATLIVAATTGDVNVADDLIRMVRAEAAAEAFAHSKGLVENLKSASVTAQAAV